MLALTTSPAHDFLRQLSDAWQPKAIVVVSLSLPVAWSNAELATLGEKLAVLREEGVLMIGSGSLVHNLAELQALKAPIPAWVGEFADWVHHRLVEDDRIALCD